MCSGSHLDTLCRYTLWICCPVILLTVSFDIYSDAAISRPFCLQATKIMLCQMYTIANEPYCFCAVYLLQKPRNIQRRLRHLQQEYIPILRYIITHAFLLQVAMHCEFISSKCNLPADWNYFPILILSNLCLSICYYINNYVGSQINLSVLISYLVMCNLTEWCLHGS